MGEGASLASAAAAPLSPELQAAFSHAISQVYLVTLLLVAAGFLMTLFVPELPLRKTNEVGPPVLVPE